MNLGSSPGSPGRRRQRVLEHTHRGGEHGTLRKQAPPKAALLPGPRALHSAVLGPCRSDPQGTELLPSTEAGVIERTVLAAQAATPPQGGRGEGRQTAWLLGTTSRPSRVALAPLKKARAQLALVPKEPRAGERGGALPGHAPRKRQTAEEFPRDGQPSRGRTRTEAASLARRRIPGSRACPRVEHALQISVVQSWPREAAGSSHRSKRSRSSRRGTGARSRVNISDGVERRSPGRSRRHDALFVGPLRETFTEASGRKARDGIGETLGSPSVLPKEGTSDRPLSSRLHGSGGTAVLARTKPSSRLRGRRHGNGRATGVSEARSHEATPANTRGPERAVRWKRATTS